MKNQNVLRAATWKDDRALFVTQAGIIAAVYVVLTVVFAPLAFKEVQVRFAEMLTILPFFFPAAVPGVFIGCILGNILGGAVLPDVVFGSLATLIGAVGTLLIGNHYRKKRIEQNIPFSGENIRQNSLTANLIIASVPPIVANTIIVPFVLKYAYGVTLSVLLMMLTVWIGEVISCGILGVLLGRIVNRIMRSR